MGTPIILTCSAEWIRLRKLSFAEIFAQSAVRYAREVTGEVQESVLFLCGAADMQLVELLLDASPFSGLNGDLDYFDMLGGMDPPAQTQLR